jgi:hypothetical protein
VRGWHVGYRYLSPATTRQQDWTKAVIVIMYIWTAPGTGTVGFRWATGVSDDRSRACAAAEAELRTAQASTGQARTARVERVYTAVAAPALNLCYIRTGTGWQARLGRAGRVQWTPFTA